MKLPAFLSTCARFQQAPSLIFIMVDEFEFDDKERRESHTLISEKAADPVFF
jgi:hypothetical protein